MTHKSITSVRFSGGIREVTIDYENLSNSEFNNDYSMGYDNQIGFRAGTATPFYFYDISNEFQLPLKVHPVFANEQGIKNMDTTNPFKKIEQYFNILPLSGNLIIALTNGFLDSNVLNNTLQKNF